MYPKPTRFKLEIFLQFLRESRCAVMELAIPQHYCTGPIDPHHTKTVGSGGSDLTAIPLCRMHHIEIGQVGVEKFERKYHIRVDSIRIDALERFIAANIHLLVGD